MTCLCRNRSIARSFARGPARANYLLTRVRRDRWDCCWCLCILVTTYVLYLPVPTGHHQPKLQPRREGHGLCAGQHRERQPSWHMGADPQDDHGSTLCVLPLLSFSHAPSHAPSRNVASEPCLNSTASLRSSVRKITLLRVFGCRRLGWQPVLPVGEPLRHPVPAKLVPYSDMELDSACGAFLGKHRQQEWQLHVGVYGGGRRFLASQDS
eukprot:COSAG05_NODE_4715_length_1399_cov_10.350000_2_plen_210_part_00